MSELTSSAKKDPGDLNDHDAWHTGEAGAKIAEAIQAAIAYLRGAFDEWDRAKGAWVQETLDRLYKLAWGKNVLIFHDLESYLYSTPTDILYIGRHILKAQDLILGNVLGLQADFRIIVFHEGFFHRGGNGGWQNWGFSGWRTKLRENEVYFHQTPGPVSPVALITSEFPLCSRVQFSPVAQRLTTIGIITLKDQKYEWQDWGATHGVSQAIANAPSSGRVLQIEEFKEEDVGKSEGPTPGTLENDGTSLLATLREGL